MKTTLYPWHIRILLGLTLAVSQAIAPAHAQLLSTATNDAYANNSTLRFNYAEALQKSVYFVEAQQNGPLSPNNRVAWRGNANLSDGSDIGRDLAGGLFDAGDHWTTNTTMAFLITTLAWSAVEKPTGWTSMGQMDELLESLVTVNDYFIKCVLNPNVSNPAQNLDIVIGCGGREAVPPPQVHAIWASAEMASAIDLTTGQPFTNRPTFRLNSTAPGGDVPSAMASAMAASSMVIRAHGHLLVGKNGFASFNPTAYADQLYDLAGKLALFANANKGAASLESMTAAERAAIVVYRSQALRSDGQVVDIQTPTGYRANPIAQTFTALTWLARATSDPTTRQSWVNLAEQVYEGPYKAENLNDWWRDYGWVNPGKLGAYNMIRLFPTLEKYHYEVQYYTASYLGYGQTPGGLRLRESSAHEYGSLRHSNNAGVIALYYSDLVDNAPVLSGNTWWKHGASNATLKAEFIRAAKRGTDYALGANPYGRSYLVGFGNQPFNSSHHRGAHGAWNGHDHFNSSNSSYNHNASRHILYGALIAGPDNRDVFLASDNNRTWEQVSGTQDFDTHYLFPNRPTERVRKSTYIFNPADQPVQDIIESKFNEVALDYNAGFMANLAWLNSNGYSNGSPVADSQFPPAVVRNESLDPWTTDREMLVTATVTQDSSSATQLDGKVWNRSRWPSRPLTSPSIRYYFTHTGTVTPTLSNATGASISAVLTDGAGQRYVEITWSGVTLNPVNSSNNARSFTLRLAATGWNSSDDWSRQNAALNTLRLLPNTPVYQAGIVVGGALFGATAVITPSQTASGTVNSAFSYQVLASNTPTSYALASGSLPTGVTLNTPTGLLSGTPSVSGTFTPSFTATNAGGTSPAIGVTLTISAVSAATLLSYEGFGYTGLASITGRTGGTGWRSPNNPSWTSGGTSGTVAASGLSYTAINPAYTAFAPSGLAGNYSGAFQNTRLPAIDASGVYDAAGFKATDGNYLGGSSVTGTLWGSVLVAANPWGTASGPQMLFNLGSTAGTGTQASIRQTAAGSAISVTNVSAGSIGATGSIPTSSLSTTTPNLIVFRYMFNGAGNDTFTVWLNPVSATDTPAITATAADFVFNNLTLRSVNANGGLIFDEIRLGTTFAVVTPYTLPAPLTALATFRTTHGLAANGSQDLLTPAGDGVQNLLKYAFNMIGTGQASALATPNASVLTANGSAGLPLVGVGTGADAGKLQLTYLRRKASASPAPGVTYAVEFSDALASWAVNGSATQSVPVSIDDFFERVTVTDSVATPTKRFVRVRVTAQ